MDINELICKEDYVRLKEAEERVQQYILELTNNNVGHGENPIDFLIASHRMLRHILDETDLHSR